jgi:hypothetical protein
MAFGCDEILFTITVKAYTGNNVKKIHLIYKKNQLNQFKIILFCKI